MTELLDCLRRDSAARLKWLVCRRLGILPGSREERRMTLRRTVECACHLLLDEGAESGNAGFDMARFRRLERSGK